MKDKRTSGPWRTAWECILASLALAVLTLVSFRLHAGPAMAALLFFFLVILISLWAGFLPTAFACAVAALCYVYFFTQPLYHLWMSEPVEIAATIAFSGTALIISRLISRVRERTAEVQQTNEQLQAEIAERRRAEDGVRQSEAELQQLVDAIPQQVFVFDANWNPLFANRREREYTGLTPEEAQSKDAVAKIFHPEDLKKLEVLRECAVREAAPFEMEARIRDKEGQYRWFLIRDNPLRDEQERVLRWYGTRTDIEDRKRAEEALRQSETQLRQEQSILTEAEKLTHTGAWEWDVVSGAWSFSDEWLRIHGTDRKTLTPEELIVIAHPDDRQSILQAFEEVRKGEKPYNIEHRIIQQDTGKVRVVRASGEFVRDEEGKVAKVCGCAQDITEQKQAEEALGRLNRELRAISNCNQTLLRATDEQSLLREICRIVCEEAGYRMAWVAYAEQDEAKSVRPVAWTGTEEQYLTNLGITWADTERGRGPTGTAIRSAKTCCIQDFTTDLRLAPWQESALQQDFRSGIALPLKDENANAFGSLTIYSAQPNAFTSEEIRLLEELAGDLAFGIITLRSGAARERAEQEVALLSFAVDRVREAALLVDDSGRFHYVNEEACRALGYSREELLDMGVSDIDPEFPAERWADHWRDLQAQRSLSFESRHRTRDGHTFPVEVSANYFEYGDRAYNLALVRDITERKKAEEERAENLRKLQESERHLRTLLENLPDCIARFDKEGRHVFVNSAVTEAFGIPTGQIIGKTLRESGAPALAPQNILLEDLIRQAFEEGIANSTEGEWVTAQGIRYFDVRHVPEKDETGNVVTVVGISRDITERKRAEEKVRQQEMELRQVLDFTPQLVAVFGHDRKRLYANRPTLDYFGVTLEEWQGISDRFWFYHPDDRERMARDVYTGPANDVPHEFEARLRRKDGAYRWFLFRDNPLRDEQGSIMRWYFTATDIEDRKRAEEERRARVWFLESMDRVNRAIGGTNDLEQMTGDVITAMLSIFESDRAFLYYPCDPDAPSFEVFMERTRRGYAGTRGVIPMTPETARGFQIVRASSGVVTFGPGCDYPLIGDFATRFGHQSSIGIALYPKTGQPWVLAMQQCSYPRAWTAEERKLLEEIARRLTDSLTSLLMFRSLRESEEALRRSEAYLTSTQKLTLTGSWALDGTTRMSLYWSEETFRMWGFDPRQGLPTWEEIMQRIHPQDLHMYKEAAERAILKREDFDLEYRIVLPDATVKHLHTLAHSVLSPAGEVLELVGTSVDITERRRAEEALRAQAALLDLTHDTVFVMDMEGVIKYWNRGAEERYGWTAEQALGRVVHDLLKTIFPGPIEEIRAEVSRTGRWEGEILHTKKDGTQVAVASRWALQRDERGAPMAILETNNDITLRKRAEEALRLSNAYNRSLIEASLDPLVTIGPDGKITDVNAATEAATGRSRSELVGTDFCDYFTEPAKARAGYEQVFREGMVRDYPLELRHRDGGVMSVLYNASVYRDESGRVTGVFAAARDISKRKRAEEALRLSNAYNRSLIEASLDPLVTIGPDGKITDVNAATEAATGRFRGELVSTDFCDYFTEPAKARAGYEQVFREGMVRDYPLELRHRDGGVMSVLYNASVYRDESGRVTGVFAAARDISKRKRAEEALRLSNAYNRSLIEASPDPLVTIGPDGKITDVNAATEAATGRSRGELVGTDFCDYFTEPAKARAGYEQVFREGMVRDYPLELRHRDGGVMSVLYNASVYRDESGRVTGVFAAARDITERQRAEEALRESETRFRMFVDHVADALFICDFEQGTIVDVNRQACESLGYTRQELIGTTGLAYDHNVDPAVTESIGERTAAGETVIDTHWHQRKDGTQFPVEAHTSQYWYGDRRFLLKIARDISDRLQAEEQRERLRQLEAELAHIDRVSMMGELVASIAHEVNQPLSGVVVNGNACLRWLAGDSPNLGEAREAVRRIVRDGKRAGEVIARIRALATKTATAKERLDMNEAIREAVALAQDELRKNRVAVRTEFADDLSPVLGDRVQLQQVVLNLVMNGIEAMSSVEERPRELIVRTQNDDAGQVRVTIRDSGMGLDPQSMERIFDAFYTTKHGAWAWGSRLVVPLSRITGASYGRWRMTGRA